MIDVLAVSKNVVCSTQKGQPKVTMSDPTPKFAANRILTSEGAMLTALNAEEIATAAEMVSQETQWSTGNGGGRKVLKGTPTGHHIIYRYDPYGPQVLEVREFPSPVHPVDIDGSKRQIEEASGPVKNVESLTAAAVVPIHVGVRKDDENPKKAPKMPSPSSHPVTSTAESVAPSTCVGDAPQGLKAERPEPTCRVNVEFKRGRGIYTSYLVDHHVGDMVVVEGDRGQDMGRVLEILPAKGPSVARVERRATQKDIDTLASLRKEETAAVCLCQQRVREFGIKNMKIEDVEFQFDHQKATIYFSSHGSVDFRQLQRQLFRDFRCRVWLRTVSPSVRREK